MSPTDWHLVSRGITSGAVGVITGRMWSGIFLVGAVMAVGTLFVLHAALPGRLVEGAGSMRYGQTIAFTTLVLGQLFNVFNARSDERSAFTRPFDKPRLWAATGLSPALQVAVLYVPFLQQAFSTVASSAGDWRRSAIVASSVLWLREAGKAVTGWRQG